MKQFQWKSLLPHAIAVGIFLIIAVIFCKPALEGKVLSQTDVSHWKGMAQDLFNYKEKHGNYPLWNNNLFGGMPAYQIAMEAANPITPVYFHQLFMLFMGKPIGYFFLLCIGFYFLSQVIGTKSWIGILGSIAYAYATYDPVILSAGHDTKMQAMGYMPALLGALWLIYKKEYWWGAALTALFGYLLIAMNHLQVTYYFLLMAGFMTIGFIIQWIKQKNYRHMGISLALAISMGLLSVGPNIVSLATTKDYSNATMRGNAVMLDSTGKAKERKGLETDYAFYYGSYGMAETYTFLVPGIYGGSSGGGELSNNSNFAKKAVEMGIPEDQAENFAGSMPTYWGPQPMTSGPVYFGAIICFLFILGMVYLKTWHRWWILAVCLLAVVMSWGSNFLSFNTFLFNNLPLYNKFRAPSIILILPQLLFPLLGMMALQQFLFEEKNKAVAFAGLKKSVYITGAFLLGAVLLYFSFDYAGKDDSIKNMLAQSLGGNQEAANGFYNALKEDRRSLFGSDLLRSLLFIAAAIGLLWLAVKEKLKAIYVLIAIIVLSSADLFSVGKRYLNERNFQDAEVVNEGQFAPTAIDQQILSDTTRPRVLNLTVDPYTDAITAYHHRSVGGYHPAKLSIYQDLIGFQLAKQPINMSVLNMLNTRYVIVPNPQNGQPSLQVNPSALGHAWFVKGIQFQKDAGEVMKAMNQFSPADTAIVEEQYKNAIPFTPVYDSTASIRQILNDNDIVRYQSTSSSNQFAVFSEIFYDRGWKATIDGKEAPIVKVNYVLRGLAIPAGNHEIVFEFKPASYYNSAKIAVITSAPIWILLILAAFFSLRKKREEKA